MEKPNPPVGWTVRDFNYLGEPASLHEDNARVLTLERITSRDPEWHDLVFLEVRGGIDEATAKRLDTKPVDNYFNVYRRIGGHIEALDPLIPTASKGIEYCLMVAERYMKIALDEIPGAREKFYQTMEEIFRLAQERGTEIRILGTGERLI